MNFPIETLLRAAGDVNVMTFRGVTRLDGTAAKPAHGQNELFHRVITYNARHRHIFCMSAQWPVEWIATVADGTQASPNRTLIEAKRIRGGNSNGAYLKKMTILIEYLRETEGQSSCTYAKREKMRKNWVKFGIVLSGVVRKIFIFFT